MKNQNKIIDRKDILNSVFIEMLKTESHHNHEIIQDKEGVFRWKPVKNNHNIEVAFSDAMGNNSEYYRNSESLRKVCRELGDSLFYYWELFYWEINNEYVNQYVPMQIP